MYIRRLIKAFIQTLSWIANRYAPPSPHFMKVACLMRHGVVGGPWIETGTYKCETTTQLARLGVPVYTIEADVALHNAAVVKMQRHPNVTVLEGRSEQHIYALLASLSGSINLWLDGHYSGPGTYLGDVETPIRKELDAVTKNLARFDSICVMIDDIRCFVESASSDASYPALSSVADWATTNGFTWHIEHDIFIAKR